MEEFAYDEEAGRKMNGGRALAEMLRLAGAGPMFGMGGFQLLPFYDAIAHSSSKHFLINDERVGAFAADAYARVTNRPGHLRRHARPRRHQPGHRPCRIAQCRHADGGAAGDANRLHATRT